jgi:hypothetical protein
MKTLLKKPHFILLNFILCILISFSACKKAPGEGGNSSIKGSVWVEDWNGSFTVKNGEYAGADEWVYIIYGDDLSYSDRIRTNYNGEYEFKYLRKGKYKIYMYSEDNTLQSESGQVSIVKDVEITDKKQTITVDRITIYK